MSNSTGVPPRQSGGQEGHVNPESRKGGQYQHCLRMAYQRMFQEVAGAEASKQSTITGNSIMQPESHPPSQEVLRKDVHKMLSACIQQLKGGGCNSAIWGSGRT